MKEKVNPVIQMFTFERQENATPTWYPLWSTINAYTALAS